MSCSLNNQQIQARYINTKQQLMDRWTGVRYAALHHLLANIFIQPQLMVFELCPLCLPHRSVVHCEKLLVHVQRYIWWFSMATLILSAKTVWNPAIPLLRGVSSHCAYPLGPLIAPCADLRHIAAACPCLLDLAPEVWDSQVQGVKS
jgi:hypothetical protein